VGRRLSQVWWLIAGVIVIHAFASVVMWPLFGPYYFLWPYYFLDYFPCIIPSLIGWGWIITTLLIAAGAAGWLFWRYLRRRKMM